MARAGPRSERARAPPSPSELVAPGKSTSAQARSDRPCRRLLRTWESRRSSPGRPGTSVGWRPCRARGLRRCSCCRSWSRHCLSLLGLLGAEPAPRHRTRPPPRRCSDHDDDHGAHDHHDAPRRRPPRRAAPTTTTTRPHATTTTTTHPTTTDHHGDEVPSSSSTPGAGSSSAVVIVLAAILVVLLIARTKRQGRAVDWQRSVPPAVTAAELARDLVLSQTEADDAPRRASVARAGRRSGRRAWSAPRPRRPTRHAALCTRCAESLRGLAFAVEADHLMRSGGQHPTGEQLASADAARRNRAAELERRSWGPQGGHGRQKK